MHLCSVFCDILFLLKYIIKLSSSRYILRVGKRYILRAFSHLWVFSVDLQKSVTFHLMKIFFESAIKTTNLIREFFKNKNCQDHTGMCFPKFQFSLKTSNFIIGNKCYHFPCSKSSLIHFQENKGYTPKSEQAKLVCQSFK